MKKKKGVSIYTMFFIVSMLCIFIMGLYLGSILQQEHFIKGAVLVAEGLEGTNIEINIDINETELIEGFAEVMNETISELNINNKSI